MRTVHIATNPVFTTDAAINADYKISNWRHRIAANVGFDTASFDLMARKPDMEEMFLNGCGRRMTRYSPDGNFLIWDGYISEMTLNEPGLQKRISLREMANGIILKYIPIDTAANPPTESAETFSAVASDAASQAIYGVKQKVFSPPITKITNADATQFGNVLLAHYRMPIRADTIASGADEPGLQVSCEGYARTLDWKTYVQTSVSGTDNANAIISTIATATGQSYIASQDLDTNTTAVQKYFNRYDTGYDLIQWIASLGDSSNNRWLTYVLEDRILHYKPAATTVDYFRRIEDGRQEIRDLQGRVIPQWEVRPNHWIRTADIFPHALTPASLKDDFQATYIESVEWSEPDTLTLGGSVGDDLQVITARLAAQGDRLL